MSDVEHTVELAYCGWCGAAPRLSDMLAVEQQVRCGCGVSGPSFQWKDRFKAHIHAGHEWNAFMEAMK